MTKSHTPSNEELNLHVRERTENEMRLTLAHRDEPYFAWATYGQGDRTETYASAFGKTGGEALGNLGLEIAAKRKATANRIEAARKARDAKAAKKAASGAGMG